MVNIKIYFSHEIKSWKLLRLKGTFIPFKLFFLKVTSQKTQSFFILFLCWLIDIFKKETDELILLIPFKVKIVRKQGLC